MCACTHTYIYCVHHTCSCIRHTVNYTYSRIMFSACYCWRRHRYMLEIFFCFCSSFCTMASCDSHFDILKLISHLSESLDTSLTSRIWHILIHWKRNTLCACFCERVNARTFSKSSFPLALGMRWTLLHVLDADASWKPCSSTECHGVFLRLWHPSAVWHHREAPEMCGKSHVLSTETTFCNEFTVRSSYFVYFVYFVYLVLHGNVHCIVSHAPGHLDETWRDTRHETRASVAVAS